MPKNLRGNGCEQIGCKQGKHPAGQAPTSHLYIQSWHLMKGFLASKRVQWIVLPLLALFVVVATGCDSSKPDSEPEPPSARFEAKMTGSVSSDMSGDASVTTTSDFGAATGAALPISIDGPVSVEGQSGLAIFLSTMPVDDASASMPEGQTLLFFLPGDDRGEERRYEFTAPFLGGDSPMTFFSETSPQVDASEPIAIYSSFASSSFTTAPVTSGALEVTKVTDEGIFGTFTLQTQAAITITLPSDPSMPFDPTGNTFEPTPFVTTIEGSFEARRVDLDDLPSAPQQ